VRSGISVIPSPPHRDPGVGEDSHARRLRGQESGHCGKLTHAVQQTAILFDSPLLSASPQATDIDIPELRCHLHDRVGRHEALFETGRRGSSSSSRLSRSNTRFSRARRSSITFRPSPTWDRCWRARSTPLRLMQITGRIMISVVIVAAFSTTPWLMQDTISSAPDIRSPRLVRMPFPQPDGPRECGCIMLCAAAGRDRSQPNIDPAQRVRSL
jgi:hypothetical protein